MRRSLVIESSKSSQIATIASVLIRAENYLNVDQAMITYAVGALPLSSASSRQMMKFHEEAPYTYPNISNYPSRIVSM
jgi:hypothetical protein